MHRPVDCYLEDVINTYKTLMAHWPLFSSKDLGVFSDRVQPFFLTPKLKPKKSDGIWFLKTLVGVITLGQIVKQIILSIPGIEANGRNFSNKTPHRIGISRIEEAQVPIDKGMRITSHR
jgi:hypothetical protein